MVEWDVKPYSVQFSSTVKRWAIPDSYMHVTCVTEWWAAGVWSEVQTCIWHGWCHCHSLSLASVKSRLVIPFWYRLTWVDLEKWPLNGCVCVCNLWRSCQSISMRDHTLVISVAGIMSHHSRARATSHGPVSVRPSVCPSQVGVLLKQLNVGSHKQHHTIVQGL